MREAIWCRVKMSIWLALFLSPILVALWGQRVDQTLTENVFLPPPDLSASLAFKSPWPSHNSLAGIDLSED